MGKIKDLTGQKFGRLLVVKLSGLNKHSRTVWLCRCDCGNERIIPAANLSCGRTESCGCKFKETHTLHGDHDKRLYNIWKSMKYRCLNKNRRDYVDYGGRGIDVCKEWLDYLTFRNWALGNGYSDNLTIDRRDNNGNYEPSNCRWVTMKVQSNNQRNTRYYTINGVTHTLPEWCEITGINYETAKARIRRGINHIEALTKPRGNYTKRSYSDE